jgi:diacylglycerol kinase family enzyme
MQSFRRIDVFINCASGSVGRTAPAEMETILAAKGLQAKIWAPEQADLDRCLREVVATSPDLLIVLAGDGTARAAAELSGPDGPVIAPLPGGTMNMLPHAIYGLRSWQEALILALDGGYELPIGGGSVDGHSFLVAAIFGSPALWAPAREAARHGQPRVAWMRARRAMRRAFSGQLRYSLDGGERCKTEAMVFMCPLTSRALDNDETALEAAALDLNGAADLFRLGFHAVTGDWRDAAVVRTERCRLARVSAKHGIPAILDGESVRLRPTADVRYTPSVARILAIPKDV